MDEWKVGDIFLWAEADVLRICEIKATPTDGSAFLFANYIAGAFAGFRGGWTQKMLAHGPIRRLRDDELVAHLLSE